MHTIFGFGSIERFFQIRKAGLPVMVWGIGMVALVSAGVGIIGSVPPAGAQGVNIEEIFWCDESIGPLGDQSPEECLEARSTVLNSCTSCHTFAPIVLAQRTEAEWDTFMGAHRERTPEVSDESYEQMTEFLKVHFNPDNPQPDLPPALRNYELPPA